MKKLISQKIKSFNYYQVAAILGMFSQVLLFVTEIFVARKLGPIDFGRFALFILIVEIVQIISFKSFALTCSIKNELSDRSLYYSLIFSISLSVFVMFSILKIDEIFSMGVIPDANFMLFCSVIIVCLCDYFLKISFLKNGRYTLVNFVDFFSVCVYISLLLVMVFKGFGWLSFVYSYLLRFLFKIIVYCFYFERKVYANERFLNFEDFKFSFSLTLQSVFLFSTSNIDKAVIVNKLGDASLGIYSRAQKLIYTPFEQIIRSTSNISFSKMNNASLDGKIVIFFNTFRLVLYTVLPVVAFIYFNSAFLVVTIYGEGWIQMASILPQISVVALLSLLSIPVGDFLKSNGIVYKELGVNLLAFTLFGLIVVIINKSINLVYLANILTVVSFLVLILQLFQASKFFKFSSAFKCIFDIYKFMSIFLLVMVSIVFLGTSMSGFLIGLIAAFLSVYFFVHESIRLRKV